MNQRANRTFVCSVLYLDIVGYSTQSVTAQLKLKQELNGLLREAMRELATVDRIVLEIAGGVVVSFLGLPADSLFVALDLRQKMAAAQSADEPAGRVRIGINLGPVRVVDDPGGQLNLVGDGINVAERIMNFAAADNILVSRSYYEVLIRQLPDFEPVFRFEGTRTDRQVREHSVFTVDLDGAALLRANLAPGALKTSAGPRRGAGAPGRASALDGGARSVSGHDELRTSVLAVTLLSALMIIGLAWTVRSGQRSPAAAIDPLAAAAVPASDTLALSPPVSSVSPAAVSSPAPVARRAGGKRSEAAPAAPVPTAPELTPSPSAAGGRAVVTLTGIAEVALTLAIAPWGEVYLDGQYQGVSPPLKKLSVSAGWHDIEVRNTTFPVFQQRFEAKSGSPLRIEHRY